MFLYSLHSLEKKEGNQSALIHLYYLCEYFDRHNQPPPELPQPHSNLSLQIKYLPSNRPWKWGGDQSLFPPKCPHNTFTIKSLKVNVALLYLDPIKRKTKACRQERCGHPPTFRQLTVMWWNNNTNRDEASVSFTAERHNCASRGCKHKHKSNSVDKHLSWKVLFFSGRGFDG